ncbi:hypothetical protein N431DRAFT_340076, partial [Stipitochalara longipes BDJ]
MAQEYQYKPLKEPDSIRLIELQPSSDSAAAIRCSLVHTTLSSEDLQDLLTHYTALSYVWGCPDKVETIWVDNIALKITASLSAALHDLRDEKNSFLLWADGICINQVDNEGKGAQVRLMGRIYGEATNTIIYLGPAGAESHECQCLRNVRQGHPPSDVQLLSILGKEWFTRVWVFQELVFAVNPWVQCGKARVRWKTVSKALRNMNADSLDAIQKKRFEIISRMYRAWENHQSAQRPTTLQDADMPKQSERQTSQNSMLKLVTDRRALGVSDPRDMVFAHIGFATDGENGDLKVDYSKTTEQVYLDFALFIKKKHGWGNLLECVGDRNIPSYVKDLPSWVPDW